MKGVYLQERRVESPLGTLYSVSFFSLNFHFFLGPGGSWWVLFSHSVPSSHLSYLFFPLSLLNVSSSLYLETGRESKLYTLERDFFLLINYFCSTIYIVINSCIQSKSYWEEYIEVVVGLRGNPHLTSKRGTQFRSIVILEADSRTYKE